MAKKKELSPLSRPAKKVRGDELDVRRIPVYYEPEDIGQKTYDKIVRFWNLDIPVRRIIPRIQQERISSGKPTLTYVDVFTTIYHARSRGLVKQRQSFRDSEPTLDQFRAFFVCWKRGGTFNQCREAALPFSGENMLRNIFRCCNQRWQEAKEKGAKKAIQKRERPYFEVLLNAQLREVDGRHAMVVFIEDVPKEQRELLFHMMKKRREDAVKQADKQEEEAAKLRTEAVDDSEEQYKIESGRRSFDDSDFESMDAEEGTDQEVQEQVSEIEQREAHTDAEVQQRMKNLEDMEFNP